MAFNRPLIGECLAELTNAGPAVEDEQRAVGRPDLDTDRVAAVADRFGPWRGNQPPRSPEFDAHGQGPSTLHLPCRPSISTGPESVNNDRSAPDARRRERGRLWDRSITAGRSMQPQ